MSEKRDLVSSKLIKIACDETENFFYACEALLEAWEELSRLRALPRSDFKKEMSRALKRRDEFYKKEEKRERKNNSGNLEF